MSALARSTDPATSHIAAERVDTESLETRVCLALALGPSTTHELAAYLDMPLVSVSPRMRPLVNKGRIRDSGLRDKSSRMPRIIWQLVPVLLLAGCALAPNSVRPEFEHMSHVSQHFNGADTHDSTNLVNLVAHWDLPHRFYAEAAEGIALNNSNGNGGFGEIEGPREQFSARIGYVFQVKP